MLILDFSYIFIFSFTFFFFNIFFLIAALDHFIITLVFLDLLLLANILLFTLHTIVTCNPVAYNYTLVIISVAAADTAIGLGLFLVYFKTFGSASILN